MNAATTVVSIERRDNVVYLVFPTSSPPPELVADDPWEPWTEASGDVSGKTATAPRPVPARWSPRPVRVLASRFARSQFAADLRQYRDAVEFLLAVLAGLYLADHLRPLVQLMFGGSL